MSTSMQTSKPWFREPWPWLLAIMPVTAVIAGGFTVWLAVTSNDGLVVDDYYKQGKAINQTKERDRRAQSLGLSAKIQSQANRVYVALAGRLETPPGQLTMKILHPTRPGDDHEIRLDWDGSIYRGTLPELGGAHYRVQLIPEFGNWRLTGEYKPGSEVVLLPRL